MRTWRFARGLGSFDVGARPVLLERRKSSLTAPRLSSSRGTALPLVIPQHEISIGAAIDIRVNTSVFPSAVKDRSSLNPADDRAPVTIRGCRYVECHR